MRFGVLGPLTVWTSGGDEVPVPGAKVRALLADLIAHEGRPVSTDQLVDDLWDGRPPGKPIGTLQAKVSQLRRALEGAEPGGRGLVVSAPAGYLLRTGADGLVDADEFAALVDRARAAGEPRTRVALYAEALQLWRGPAFADFDHQPWARAAITRLEEQQLVALEEHAEVRLALGEHSQLTGELSDLVTRHPLRERLRAAHMRALYRAGRQSEALASYDELRGRLVEELGLDPTDDLAALHLAILRHDPALDLPAPPLPRVRGYLPAALTELVGRADALARVRVQLAANRLVTLTGPGGVGKTRLAIEAAAAMGGTCPDGIWLVELASISRTSDDSIASLARAVSTTLGVREPAGLDELAAVLGPKRSLLVVDNCEHVVDHASDLAQRLLAAAPGLRILATSREPLRLAGEVVWTVPSLEIPDPAAHMNPEALRTFSAVRLFVARARAAAPGFTLDAANAPAVATICQQLDGIPLALELAATRVRSLGVDDLAARLDDRFRALAPGHRGGPPRHQTLQAVIAWSWDLLTEPERAVLRRLGPHAGGFDLDAARAICPGDGLDAARVDELLARLVDRSLVSATAISTGPAPRYRLLESVAAYAVSQLAEAGEADTTRRRHGHYYIELAEQGEHQLRAGSQRAWLERLDHDTANLRRALENATRSHDADLALRLVNAAAWYWFLRGRLREARRSLEIALAIDPGAPTSPSARTRAMAWLAGFSLLVGDPISPVGLAAGQHAALDLCEGIASPRARARAQWFLGFATSDWGDLTASETLVDTALATFRDLGDHWGTAAALSTRAKQAHNRGDLAAVRRNGEQSLALFSDLGDRWGQLQAIEWLGAQAKATGDYDRATRLYQDGLGMAEELGLWPQAADQLSWLGRIALVTGDPARAKTLHEHARRLALDHGYIPGAGFAEVGLGQTARRDGDLDTAERHLQRVLDHIRLTGLETGVADALILSELGFIAEQRGDADTARNLHSDCLAVARKIGDPRTIALALEGLAGAEALAGDPEHAAQLLGAATATRAAAGAPLPPAERFDTDRITTRVRASLSDSALTAALQRGTELAHSDIQLAGLVGQGHRRLG
ncbi:MAG TPA: BTAD domain-containing putative transcriptional regulator [Acidimicrobiales bacterium]|nr:BTAD domain-containing putative transcriptional regulator [Acidimicrobiales bacterium]